MNSNTMGVAKINENEILNSNKPKGFIAREKIIDGKAISFEYGIYLTDDVFLGVPLHFTLKEKLIPSAEADPNYKYYLIPQNLQFAVTTYTNKKTGKVNPLLVEPSDKKPAMFISCLAFGDNVNTILSTEMDNNSLVIRKYIDKDRKVIGLIVLNPNTESINPTTTIKMTYGIPNNSTITVADYKFNPMLPAGYEKIQDTIDLKEGAKTSFIKLKNFIKPQKESNKNENKTVKND